MTDYMSITDPAELRAAVDRNLRENPFAFMVADASADEVLAATAFAPHNKFLLTEGWIANSIPFAARDDDGIHGLPIPGEAFIVPSDTFSYEATGGSDDGWHRTARPLPTDGGPLHRQSTGRCHRCSPPFGGSSTEVSVFHVARGRVVVEFVVCEPCLSDIETHGAVTLVEVPSGSV